MSNWGAARFETSEELGFPLSMPAVCAEASAPGKSILIGEHSAVYGAPAVVAAVGLRTRVRVELSGSAELAIELEDFGDREELTWEQVRSYGHRRRELWRAFEAEPSAESFASLSTGDGAGVVKIAVAEALRFVERGGTVPDLCPTRLAVGSDLPVGSGLGSSASVAVAVVAALFSAWAVEVRLDDVSTVALEIERRQHGRPSGIDHATVLRGGFLAFERTESGLAFDELARPAWLRDAAFLFDTGTPAQSTGEVVAAVRERRDQDPQGFGSTLEEMTSLTRAFTAALVEGKSAWVDLVAAVRGFQSCLEELGVVPVEVADRVRRVERAGGAAKISGAGALSGESAGSLLVVWPPDLPGEPAELLSGYRRLEASLGAEGLAWGRM